MDVTLTWFERADVWTDKTGEIRPIKELTTAHLQNILSFLERNARNYKKTVLDAYNSEVFSPAWAVIPDQLLEDFESKIDTLIHTPARDWVREWPIYQAICEELEARQTKATV